MRRRRYRPRRYYPRRYYGRRSTPTSEDYAWGFKVTMIGIAIFAVFAMFSNAGAFDGSAALRNNEDYQECVERYGENDADMCEDIYG